MLLRSVDLSGTAVRSALSVHPLRLALVSVVTALLVLPALIGGAAPGWAQSGQQSLGLQEQGAPPSPQPATPEPQPPPPVRQDNPGLFQEMGKLFDKMLPQKKPEQGGGTASAPPPPSSGDATKGIEDALSRLKPSTMVTGRSACPLAANRTPDCKAGADKLCQSKGYKEGNSLNTDATESCSAKVLIPGRARKPDDCHTDTYVTSALCQ
jgi:hypothetical protein